ncbi:MAG: PorT family protein [Bacteroidota bacterium]|nr:PorT family protein [Bacteroidota bacterium]MDX5429525.1 PorT family protein [Bacteroidota bacterium]MDX5468312.1 PorT family protein [Bacteroidota bacterium]
MKKHVALIMFALIGFNAMAQSDGKESKLHLGLIGLNSYGWMSTESKNISNGGIKAGVALGIYGDYYFAKNYAFTVELLHSTQGFKAKADSILSFNSSSNEYLKSGGVTIDYKMRSFQIPITLKLRTNEIGYWRYFGQIGVAPSFTYKAIKADFSPNAFVRQDDNTDRLVNDAQNDFILNDPQINPDNQSYFLEEDNVSGIRVPILIGAGAEWNLSGNTALLFGLRYEYGLLNMMKAENTIGNRNVLSLAVGVRF